MPTDPRRRPDPADLRRGGRFGRHHRPNIADDHRIRTLVEAVFDPKPLFEGLPVREPGDETLIRQLIDHAPRPEAVGRDDWHRPLRADEVAEIWGEPLEGPDTRLDWLRRADEVARAWGTPLFGPGGLLPDTTVETAARPGE